MCLFLYIEFFVGSKEHNQITYLLPNHSTLLDDLICTYYAFFGLRRSFVSVKYLLKTSRVSQDSCVIDSYFFEKGTFFKTVMANLIGLSCANSNCVPLGNLWFPFQDTK